MRATGTATTADLILIDRGPLYSPQRPTDDFTKEPLPRLLIKKPF